MRVDRELVLPNAINLKCYKWLERELLIILVFYPHLRQVHNTQTFTLSLPVL